MNVKMKSNIKCKNDVTLIALVIPVIPVGTYVNYDVGEWTEEDFQLIRESEGKPTVNNSTKFPTEQGQFGGFELNQSRNFSSTKIKLTDHY